MTPANVAIFMGEVSDLDTVAVDDSFFDLGGNSLTATTLISKIYLASGVKLLMREIVRAPTPARVSQLIIANSAGSFPRSQ
jgi:acyl carrier protein